MGILRKVDASLAARVTIGPKGLTNNLGALLESPNQGLKGVPFEVRTLENGNRIVIAETTRMKLAEVLKKIGYEIVEPDKENNNGGGPAPVLQ